MKSFAVACVATVFIIGSIGSVSGREISKSTLGSMGLNTMQQLSDNDGLAIRGKGTSASVWGSGVANFHGGTTQSSGYAAAVAHNYGSSTASGGDFNLVGVAHGTVGGSINFVVIGAVGGSFASAK